MNKFVIQDWAGNVIRYTNLKTNTVSAFAAKFESFEDAEEYLIDLLGDDYETDRGEYYIVEGVVRESRYLDPNDVRNNSKLR